MEAVCKRLVSRFCAFFPASILRIYYGDILHLRFHPLTEQSKFNLSSLHASSIDPISLSNVGDVLLGLLQLILEGIDAFNRLDRLPTEYQRIAQDQKQSLDFLLAEVHRASEIFDTIVGHSDEEAVNALLNSDEGDATYRRITQELDKIKANIVQQIQATDNVISNVNTAAFKGGRVNVSIKVVGGKDVAAKLATNLRARFQDVEKSRENLLAESQHFHQLYQVQCAKRTREVTQRLRDNPSLHRCCSFTSAGHTMIEHPTHRNLLHYLKHAFRTRPFQIDLKSSKVQDADALRDALTSMGTDHWEDNLSQLMKAEGARWIEEANKTVDTNSAAAVASTCLQTYNKLLSNTAFCVSSLGSALSCSADGANTERDAQLESISYDIAQLMRGTEASKVSVAFCGMVKAG
jgi:hypothetical protein